MNEIIKNKILEIIKELQLKENIWSALDLKDFNFGVDFTKDENFGDLTTNVAMIVAGKLKQSPIIIAEKIVEDLRGLNLPEIKEIKVVSPGYINFFLANKFFSTEISKIIEADKKWGEINNLENKNYIFEHSSPNLFKPFHIGHLVNNAIGESLYRIIKKSGAEVLALSFPSDISPGIAKTVWAIKEKNWQDEMTIEKIGEAYVFGSKSYKENEEIKNEIDKINKKLYQKEKCLETEIYQKGQKLSLEYFESITQRLGSKFDDLIFESEAEVVGKKIILENVPQIFKESQGAIVFMGSEYGLFDNVFINSQGFGTYLAKDMGLLKIKFDRFKFDKSITITDVEQRDHFKMVKKAGELISNEWAQKSEYIQHGRLKFAGEKISSRLGNVPLAEDLIKKVKDRIFQKIENQDLSPKEKEEIAEKVSIGALKYSILRCGAGKNIMFDFEKATAFEGDTGPYLQYALVRTNSILKNAKDLREGIDFSFEDRKGEVPLVEKMILKFPQMIEKSLLENSPHHLANYLFKLSSEFSSFYAQTRILDKTNSDFKNNLALAKAMQITLKNGLELLGIETLERM